MSVLRLTAQRRWTEEEYLAYQGNRLIEFSDGLIEVLPMPTFSHHRILAFLYAAMLAFVTPLSLGSVYFAGVRVKIGRGKYREPDLVFVQADHEDWIEEDYAHGADLVMEIVSGSAKDRKRDLEEKPVDYARARIPEYWIVDPKEQLLTILRLRGQKYVVHGEFGPGERATSALLKGFGVNVDDVFAVKGAKS